MVARRVRHLCLAVSCCRRRIQAVGDARIVAAPTHETATVGRGSRSRAKNLPIEQTALNTERAVVDSFDAAVRAVTADIAMDDHAAAAVLEVQYPPVCADKTRGALDRSVDVAVHVQVADGGRSICYVTGVQLGGGDVAERSCILVRGIAARRTVIKSQRVPLSVEDAGEIFVVAACLTGYLDVCGQFHYLAGEDALGALGQHVAEDIPALGSFDGVLCAVIVDFHVVGTEGTQGHSAG